MLFSLWTGPLRRLATVFLTASLGIGLPAVKAQEVPPLIKVLVGFPAGAGTDLMARAYANALAEELKNSVVVDNRPGAGGQIAARMLKEAAEDGSTVMMAIDHQIVMIPLTVKAPGYHPQQDFQPILQLATYDICAGVSGKVPAKSFDEWAKLAGESKEYRSIGIPAVGSNAHFLAKVIAQHFGVMMDVVSYKGGAPLIADVSGGHVSAFVLPCGDPIVTAHESGRARILLTSAETGHPRAPQAISFIAAGLQVPSSEGYFIAVYASAKLAPGVADALRRASAAVAARPDMPGRIVATGMVPATATADALRDRAARSAAVWGDLIRKSGFALE